jgi:hypothetical protein
VRETATERFYYKDTIHLGPEIGELARQMGKPWGDFTTLQYVFLEPDAYRLLWSCVMNAHYYWKILAVAAEEAGQLRITVASVRKAILKIREDDMDNPVLDGADDPAEASLLVVDGFLLIKIDSRTNEISLVENVLYVNRNKR